MRAIPRRTLLLALLLAPWPTWAHAFLQGADPKVGATVSTAPPVLSLRFSEAVEPAFSTIAVRNAAGERVDKADPRVDPDDGKALLVSLPALPPGTYVVRWQVLSVDTHRTEGSFRFTVAP